MLISLLICESSGDYAFDARFIGEVVNRHCIPDKGAHGLHTRADLHHGFPEPGISFIPVFVDKGLQEHDSTFRWRCPLAFQVVRIVILLLILWGLHEPPPRLISSGRRSKAVDILARIRRDLSVDGSSLLAGLEQRDIIVRSSN